MAAAGDFTNKQNQYTNIQEVLNIQLKKLLGQSPEQFPVPIYVLAAVDNNIEGQFEESLQQETKDHFGERIILIPYHLSNFHWIGIVIKFQANGQIKEAEYMDPVNGMNTVPNRLQSRFTKIYPDMIIQKRDSLKHDDPRCSATLTIKNLLAAVKNDQQISDGNESIPSERKQNIPDKVTEETEKKMKVFSNETSQLNPDTLILSKDDPLKAHQYLKNLREDLDTMPSCAEKTIMELLLQFGESITSLQKDSVSAVLQNLKDQLKREELLSETNRTILQNLEISLTSNDAPSIVRCLKELLRQFRSLNLSDIRRLIEKSKEAAELIRNKEIILLVGETGTGKSTTIQFLAGCIMQETRVEIAPGKFLEHHITAVGPVKNPQLKNVISSPLSRSETRYMTPVTISLKDIFGAQRNGFMTLCDAPGFDDTGGAEVDIANSIGVIEALKGTKSVKILALSSYQSLGDRGQGIQKLAHILINMMQGIESRLDAIFYAFTKYPKKIDINALLVNIKTSRVDSDPSFTAVLTDMIDKTEDGAYKIDPIHDDPKMLIRKLERMRGIMYPEEVFRLLISEATRAYLVSHVQRNKGSIIHAMKCKDINLVLYYLNDLKLLYDWIKENIVRDSYEDATRFVSESVSEYCTDVMEKFNRTLASQDGLNEKDIGDYKTLVEYLEQTQILKEHLGSSLLSPGILIQNIVSTLQERNHALEREELHSPLIRIYLNNFRMLNNSFKELTTYYSSSCKELKKRFEDLVQSVREPILSNDVKHVAELFLKISKCLPLLKDYLGEKITDKYREIIQFLLQLLNSFSKEADILLVKIRLSENDIERFKYNIEILQSAKQNPLLQDSVSVYFEMLEKSADINQIPKDLNGIYEEFVEKIINYFDNITVKIDELFKTNREHILEDIERLVNDLDAIRTLPDFQSKTAEKYYRIAENIRKYMQQLQTDAEQLILSLQQSKTTNYKQLARLLSRLKKAEWIDRILPGTYNTIMHRLTDELVEYIQQLENRLKKLDLSLKCPDNISVGLEILERMESISILERSIPELEQYRRQISQYFQKCVQGVFDRILKTFDLNELEEVNTANNALIYLSQCEKVSYDHIGESAIHHNESLQKYIGEYGAFLNQEINRTFQQICRIDENLSQHSQELQKRLSQLSSLSKFTHIFKCIEGNEKIDHWQQAFLHYYRTVSANLEEYNHFRKNKEFRDQLIAAQALTCVDRFCVNLFGDHGFASLYRRYQIEMTRASKEAYQTALDYISKEDYAKADLVLHDIDKTLLNAKDLSQIQHDLTSSLNRLMSKTRSMIIWLDKNMESQVQIKEMKENMDKIRIASNQSNLIDFLDDEIRTHLRSFDNEMNETLSGMIFKGFNSVEVYLDTDHFLEAEQGLENLYRIQRDLTGYCTSPQLTKRHDELKERLNSTVNNILKRENFTDINTYAVHPPKDLLDKLKILTKHGNSRYNQVYLSLLANIKRNFSLEIEKVRLVPLDERYMKIRALNHALHFLPEDLQLHFKLQIGELNKLIVDDEKAHRDDPNVFPSTANDDDTTIRKIASLAQRYKAKNMPELLEILCEKTLTELRVYQKNVQDCLSQQEIASAFQIGKKIFQYKELIGGYFPEIEEVCHTVHFLISKDFLNCCEVFANLSSMKQIEIIDNEFNHLILYLDFFNTLDKTVGEFFPENVCQEAQKRFQRFFEYLKLNSKQYQLALNEMNFIELDKMMMITKKSEELLKKMKQCQLKHELTEILLKEMQMGISYTEMIFELAKTINHLITQLEIEPVDNGIKFEEELYKNSLKIISIFKMKNSALKDILLSAVDIDRFKEGLKTKIEHIGNQLVLYASKTDFSARDSDYFRMCYNNLSLFDQDIHLQGMNTRHFLNLFQEKIGERISEKLTTSISDVRSVAELLIKLKYFAGKLSICNDKIDSGIDEILNMFNEDQSPLQIKRLIMELDRSGIGRRLISEHDYLSGEGWQKRRKKMQNQDNLEYVLGNLYGDEVDKNMLAVYYNTFKQIYENLKSSILRSFHLMSENEPDLGMLITQTKRIAETIAQNASDYRITERIIELIAHLFAVWTFTNTQYYTAQRPYLLIPHTAQVIAIFRLLGIGYHPRMPMTSSKLLVNNLVEIGTGEGKSVVLAITACAFALIGLEVNCSCYSEVLSKRDRNNFISVFRALNIEEHITYGSFNQLCEQLSNAQGNVREKVREMIVNNKTVLTVDPVKLSTRLKVLLIDEVDVFLSEKFYGEMFTSSVVVKSPQIQTLLDAIWQDRTVQTLDEVKVISSYKICATKYSHWIFLFDEAIQDMLIALQSFESSTYLVQNDKIVYVEGESVVDNVIHGYNTIWAYYHECKEGNISQRSLADNVGIIVNCGTFSYAELPHDFYHIAGVTGTLRTLAELEKDILRRMYAIDRNTYIPSVFGKSHRTFNFATDIHVVEQSAYFTKIRTEIDLMCRANRAIFIFFESEEKLMAFYHSVELSSVQQNVQIVTEKVSVKERKLRIARAASIGRVTLFTRIFGRGTDFVCRDQQLLANGGVHVLQTFFSEELSEEYQIMGRGARQGECGSYRMVLLDKNLAWVLGSAWKEELSKIAGSNLYEAFNKARNHRYGKKCFVRQLNIEQCQREHRESVDFTFALCAGELKTVKRFLGEQNRGDNSSRSISRQFCL